MKKFIATIAAAFVCLSLFAQGTVTTRKYRLNDFTDKVTQVVLPGNSILANALKQEVTNLWKASAFEFCTSAEFEARKTSDQYYFLLLADSASKDNGEEGITFLTLLKGDAAAANGLSKMPEIISLPVCPAEGNSGRELLYLGALVGAVQDFALAAMESEKTAYQMDGWFNEKYAQDGKKKRIYLALTDISMEVSERDGEKYLDDDILLCDDEEEANRMFQLGSYNTLVGFVVAPSVPTNGAWCYKLLVDAETHTLYYLRRHKISNHAGVGFLTDDLKRMAKGR
jgi:hypothetical protein